MEFIKSLLAYFFSKAPGPEMRYYIPLTVLVVLLIVGYFVFSAIYKSKKKHDFAFKRLFRKVPKVLLTFGIVLILLLMVRRENIPYFSMRIWLYITFAAMTYFAYRYIKIYKTKYPLEKENAQKKPTTANKKPRYTTSKR